MGGFGGGGVVRGSFHNDRMPEFYVACKNENKIKRIPGHRKLMETNELENEIATFKAA